MSLSKDLSFTLEISESGKIGFGQGCVRCKYRILFKKFGYQFSVPYASFSAAADMPTNTKGNPV